MSDEITTVDLPAKFTVDSAKITKKFLIKTVGRANQFALNASKILQIDISGLQLLVAFTRELNAENKNWEWIEPSEVLLSAAKVTGLEQVLNLNVLSD